MRRHNSSDEQGAFVVSNSDNEPFHLGESDFGDDSIMSPTPSPHAGALTSPSALLSSLTTGRQNRWFLWIVGLLLLLLLFAPQQARILQPGSRSFDEDDAEFEARTKQLGPTASLDERLAATNAEIVVLRGRLAALSEQVDKSTSSKSNVPPINAENVEKILGDVQQRMERVEDAAFSDGSNAFISVMENAFFSPTGKRWVKLCEWESCQFQTLAQSVVALLKRHTTTTTKSASIRAVYLSEGPTCPSPDGVYVQTLEQLFGDTARLATVNVSAAGNCSSIMRIGTMKQILEQTADKSLDAIVFEGNGQEHVKPVLEARLRQWFPKLRVGGVALGQDYVVSKPFNARWKPKVVATPNERATKIAVDTYRTGDDNELGQEDTVRVAGGSLWYFVKIKASIFGAG